MGELLEPLVKHSDRHYVGLGRIVAPLGIQDDVAVARLDHVDAVAAAARRQRASFVANRTLSADTRDSCRPTRTAASSPSSALA